MAQSDVPRVGLQRACHTANRENPHPRQNTVYVLIISPFNADTRAAYDELRAAKKRRLGLVSADLTFSEGEDGHTCLIYVDDNGV